MDTNYQPVPRPAPTGGRKIVMDYMAEQYGTIPEYPWLQYPNYCTFKTAVRRKWYAAILDIKAHHLGLPTDQIVDVLLVKVDPERLPTLIDGVHYFAGYHMNKRHWLSVLLSDDTDYARVRELLDASYALVERSKK